MSLDHLWAGWRMPYVSTVASEAGVEELPAETQAAGAVGAAPPPVECVFCAIASLEAGPDERLVVHDGPLVFAILNAYPYASGHLMVMPRRHLRDLEELTEAEEAELWPTVRRAVAALKAAYSPDGCNVGLNLGRAAGAGIPGHLHVHAVPRWIGDTNFMTATASVRVLPEALTDSAARIRDAWR